MLNLSKKVILSGCLIVNDNKEILLLYRNDHHHYETPGGKIKAEECYVSGKPTIEELAKAAEREAYEELGKEMVLDKLTYFGSVDFVIPDGRKAVAHKFVTRVISGTPRINEPEQFSRMDYLPISRLEEYSISPDLRLLLLKLKENIIK
jgi:8-oxo-dGTP pyrophosphatase MutT (NUDIX family)